MLVVQLKKEDYNIKISEIGKKRTDHNHDKYITSPEFHKLTAEVFDERLKRANSVTKTDFDTNLSSLNQKINLKKTKYLLVENEFKKLKAFDSSYFRGKSHFEEDGTQNYLVFEPMIGFFKKIAGLGNGSYIYYWESKGLSNKRINCITTSNQSITPNLSQYGNKTRVEFNGSYSKQDKVIYTHGKIVNIYIVDEINKNYNISSYPTLGNCLFGAVSLTKHADIDQYK